MLKPGRPLIFVEKGENDAGGWACRLFSQHVWCARRDCSVLQADSFGPVIPRPESLSGLHMTSPPDHIAHFIADIA